MIKGYKAARYDIPEMSVNVNGCLLLMLRADNLGGSSVPPKFELTRGKNKILHFAELEGTGSTIKSKCVMKRRTAYIYLCLSATYKQ